MMKQQRPSNRPSKQRERFDFKFSNFQALQVLKGWDRLFVSLVSSESGRTIAKLGKALVKNGSCIWSEAISESIYLSRHDSSKSLKDCLVKFVVSTGSTRSNNTVLGEITINMAQHATSRTSSALSQPLKKCSYGTILQVQIQRVALPKPKIRDEGSKADSQEKVEDVDHFSSESKSHRSDDSSDGTDKPPREDPATSSRPFKSESEEVSESATAMINSFSSVEGSYERENSSMEKSFRSEEYNPHHSSVDDDSPSNQSPADSREVYSRENSHNEGAVSRRSMSNAGSSRNLLEAAEETIEELRAEAKMWERNARKLMIDLDISRKDFSDLSKNHAELGVELSAACAENDGLKRQVEKVKEEMQQLAMNEAIREAPVVQSRSHQEELENEIKYQQNWNGDLGQQLKQSQESNIELVSVLQELEETIEQQRIEIENLSSLNSNFMDLQSSVDRHSEENKSLLLQLEKLEESEKNLKCNIRLLDEALREKSDELEKDNTELSDENLELLFKLKDSNKTDIRKCSSFDSVTSEHLASCPSDDSEVSDPKYQVSNLEEDLEKEESSLHFSEILEQMDIAFHLLMKPSSHGRFSAESDGYSHGLVISDKIDTARMSVEYIRSLLQEMNKLLETRIEKSDDILRNHGNEINERDAIVSEARKRLEVSILEVQELEKTKAESEESTANLMREMGEKLSEISLMEAELLSKEEETNNVVKRGEELEAQVSGLLEEKASLQASLEEVRSEAESTKDKLNAALQESESKVEGLTDQLAASIQSYERLMADYERILKLVANYRKVEEKLKTDLNDIELKHTISDYERQQLTKEMSGLKVQLQRISELEEEVSILKSELEECKLHKGKVELALLTISGDYEELKGEKMSLSEKISVLEDAMLEFEECKRQRTHVEEKLLQMEKGLSAKETLHIQNEGLKNEVTEMKRSNAQFQQMMYRLEMEKDECSMKVQDLEDNLKQMHERNNIHKEEAHNNQEILEELDSSNGFLLERQKKGGGVVARERYERTKSSLETELRDLRERYLNMSLKYAEVEEQREDLVMKLKSSTGGKKWFS